MGTIARAAKAGGGTNYNSGQTIDPNENNTDDNTLYTELNGLLDDGNIETATIPGAKSLRFTEITAPSSPSTNDGLLYAKDNGSGTTRLYFKESDGTETRVILLSDLFADGTGREVKNLIVTPKTGATQSAVTITADAIDIEGYRATSVSVEAALTASGAAGLDTGAEAINTHYYLWLIRKSTDGTVNALWSASATAPTMPSGYDQKRLISARRNDSASNLYEMTQQNELALGMQNDAVSSAISAGGDQSFVSFVPFAIAEQILVRILLSGSGSWTVQDKDFVNVDYFNSTSASIPQVWVRQNSSGLVTAVEESGTATFTMHVIGFRVKGL